MAKHPPKNIKTESSHKHENVIGTGPDEVNTGELNKYLLPRSMKKTGGGGVTTSIDTIKKAKMDK